MSMWKDGVERAEYDSKTDKIELFRQARLKRGSDEVQGDYISYDMDGKESLQSDWQ